eukprot:1368310-Amorphochlora_amoeboformis.AAC.2
MSQNPTTIAKFMLRHPFRLYYGSRLELLRKGGVPNPDSRWDSEERQRDIPKSDKQLYNNVLGKQKGSVTKGHFDTGCEVFRSGLLPASPLHPKSFLTGRVPPMSQC